MRTHQKRSSERGGAGGREVHLWKGLAAGVVGGLVASAVMNKFQALWSRLAEGEERSHGAQSLQQGAPRHGIARELQAVGKDDDEDDAPERLANAISVGVSQQELTQREKDTAATALHYAMGATSGALYGAAAEIIPAVKVGAGVPFGTVIWLAVDEGLVPAVGLSKSPAEYPLPVHLYSFSSHVVFGLTTELVRRAVRNAL
jgi:uncharacterized membrane protein YagU involved in acid resistance